MRRQNSTVSKCCVIAAICLGITSCSRQESPTDGDAHRVALILPEADVSEMTELGLFALDLISPDFECSEYLEGSRDPISEFPDLIVASTFIDTPLAHDEFPVSFTGIPIGNRSILVEAYDSGGSRIFLGCQQVPVSEGATNTIEIEMVEDPASQSSE